MSELTIAGICGSLRGGSLNRRALLAWATSLPPQVLFQDLSIEGVPLYNADIDPVPEAVVALKQAIAAADAVVIATPEFNYGIPGVLKNALDWASRPAYKSVFAHKPLTMLGAAPGPVGTARAQGQLKQVLLGMLGQIYPCPELVIGGAEARLGTSGSVTDPALAQALERHAREFTAWVRKLRSNEH